MDTFDLPGYGDVATWGGRHYDDGDDCYEQWRESVPIIDAIGIDEASLILEELWSGTANNAAEALHKAYSKAWEAVREQRRESESESELD